MTEHLPATVRPPPPSDRVHTGRREGDYSSAPTTTAEQDRKTASQRRVNIIWEITQATIAIAVTGAFVYAALNVIISETLTNAAFLIVGFYFGRTNHQRIGGVGGSDERGGR
jgi:hypothetical protein